MKIDQDLHRVSGQGNLAKEQPRERTEESFAQALTEEISQGVAQSKKPDSVGPSLPPLNAQVFLPLSSVHSATTPDRSRSETLGFLEHVLDLLDQYREDLLDPAKSFKSMDTLIGELERRVGRLHELLGSYPESDELAQIINQTAIRTQVEIMKFRQGALI